MRRKLLTIVLVAVLTLAFSFASMAKADECPTFDSMHKEFNAITGFQYKKEFAWFFNSLKYAEKHPCDEAKLMREQLTKQELCHQMRVMRSIFLEDPFELGVEIGRLMIAFPEDYKSFAMKYWNAKEE